MIKKFKMIIFSIIAILIITSNNIYAAEYKLEITGDDQSKAGESKTLNVKLVSEENIGVISGKVSSDKNVENIEVKGKNNWNLLAYENGSFKLVKTSGGKNEDVFEITYTIEKETNEDVNLKLTNIVLTTSEYEEKTIEDISKTITIKKENENNPNSSVNNNINTNNTVDKIEINNQSSNKNTQNKITNISSTSNKVTNKDTTVSNKVLADAGTTSIIIYVILGVIAIGLVFYTKYKKI